MEGHSLECYDVSDTLEPPEGWLSQCCMFGSVWLETVDIEVSGLIVIDFQFQILLPTIMIIKEYNFCVAFRI